MTQKKDNKTMRIEHPFIVRETNKLKKSLRRQVDQPCVALRWG